MSIRTGDESRPLDESCAPGLVASLPTHIADPIERVRAVHATMEQAKANFDLIPADVSSISARALPGARHAGHAHGQRHAIADRMNPPVNLVISNVPGPREPLYMGGALLKPYYPVSTVVDGQGT